jgi:hypothetical protein
VELRRIFHISLDIEFADNNGGNNIIYHSQMLLGKELYKKQ